VRPERGYVAYLEDIFTAMAAAMRFTHGMTFEAFVADEKTVYATVRALEIMGEAAKRVPAEIRARYPAIPWRNMAGIRDVVIHEYDRVDREIVWKTVHSDLPEVEPEVRRAFEMERQSEGGDAT
jgi:uncharacterized protein with HEPN domain